MVLLRFEDFYVDSRTNYIYSIYGDHVELEPKEMKLLRYFLVNNHKILSKDEILINVWGDIYKSNNIVTQKVSRLRKKLKELSGGTDFIKNHTKKGYSFVFDVSEENLPDDLPTSAKRMKEYLDQLNLNSIERESLVITLKENKEIVKHSNSSIERNDDIIQNDPFQPEFPYLKPAFPASWHRFIQIDGFEDVRIKSESLNPTGTHKDRMALEIVNHIRKMNHTPQLSLISSGSSANAVQTALNYFEIRIQLRVMMDIIVKSDIKQALEDIGCKIYEVDLSSQLFDSDSIKEKTGNINGIDLTYGILDPTFQRYYDWLAYEIFLFEPDYCFMPFGTGELYMNVVNVLAREVELNKLGKSDPRFFGNINNLKKCHFYGASASIEGRVFDKLYAHYTPGKWSKQQRIDYLKKYKKIGSKSKIVDVEPKYLETAERLCIKNNIDYEPSGIAGLALLFQLEKEIDKKKKILIINTGKTKYCQYLSRR